MARYRIHQFDEHGHVATTTVVECSDDGAAVLELDKLQDGSAVVELWNGGRCVARSAKRMAVRRTGRMRWPRL